jgi:uncharacterized protein YjhX (UPF0386 family)
MRKTKEVLRLRYELGLGQRAIARSCSISQGAVHNYLKKATAAGIHWPLPEGWDEQRIEEALFGDRRPVEQRTRVLPDFPAPREQLQRHPYLTLAVGLGEVMRGYAQFTARKKIETANFFVTRDGKALNVVTLAKTFQRLRRVARIACRDGGCYRPRMHDLRHTFAVHL